eukprot:5278578-Amphidinium_carterae.1
MKNTKLREESLFEEKSFILDVFLLLLLLGMTPQGMRDVRTSARRALGKGANLGRSAPLELMALGGS